MGYGFQGQGHCCRRERECGVLTAIVTGNGVVEWQYYAPTHEEFMKNLNETLATRPRYPITIALQDDPNGPHTRSLRANSEA